MLDIEQIKKHKKEIAIATVLIIFFCTVTCVLLHQCIYGYTGTKGGTIIEKTITHDTIDRNGVREYGKYIITITETDTDKTVDIEVTAEDYEKFEIGDTFKSSDI